VEILEAKLGDVVSGDLCCLVNKLCEAATSSYYAVKSCPPTNDRFWRKAAVHGHIRSRAAEPTCRTGGLRSRDVEASSAPSSDRVHAAYLASVRTGG